MKDKVKYKESGDLKKGVFNKDAFTSKSFSDVEPSLGNKNPQPKEEVNHVTVQVSNG